MFQIRRRHALNELIYIYIYIHISCICVWVIMENKEIYNWYQGLVAFPIFTKTFFNKHKQNIQDEGNIQNEHSLGIIPAPFSGIQKVSFQASFMRHTRRCLQHHTKHHLIRHSRCASGMLQAPFQVSFRCHSRRDLGVVSRRRLDVI